MTDIQVKTFKVLPKQEETAPTEIAEYTKKLLQILHERYQEETKQLVNIERRHKQNLLDLVRRTPKPYQQVIIAYLQSDLDHWLKLTPEDIEYMEKDTTS